MTYQLQVKTNHGWRAITWDMYSHSEAREIAESLSSQPSQVIRIVPDDSPDIIEPFTDSPRVH